MTIETKYNIGDEVWINGSGVAKKVRVCRITAFLFIDGTIIIEYALENALKYALENLV